jgi:hypothetical protein
MSMARLKEAWGGLSPGRKRMLKTGSGVLLGALLGYAYYEFFGCNGGGCSVAANPWVMALAGAALGAVLVGE